MPQDTISSYAILNKCENIIIYGSRIGIELAAMGKPVIVCGEGFVRNKNIAKDISSKEQTGYLTILAFFTIIKCSNAKRFSDKSKKIRIYFF